MCSGRRFGPLCQGSIQDTRAELRTPADQGTDAADLVLGVEVMLAAVPEQLLVSLMLLMTHVLCFSAPDLATLRRKASIRTKRIYFDLDNQMADMLAARLASFRWTDKSKSEGPTPEPSLTNGLGQKHVKHWHLTTLHFVTHMVLKSEQVPLRPGTQIVSTQRVLIPLKLEAGSTRAAMLLLIFE